MRYKYLSYGEKHEQNDMRLKTRLQMYNVRAIENAISEMKQCFRQNRLVAVQMCV